MSLALVLVAPAFAAGEPLADHLTDARAALVRAEEGVARSQLADARAAAAGAKDLVPPEEIARIHLYEGALFWMGGLQSLAFDAWRAMWAVRAPGDPDAKAVSDTDGQDAMYALRSEGPKGEPVRLSVIGQTEGALLLVDGTRADSGTSIGAGEHLLQIRCADGKVTGAWAHAGERTLDFKSPCTRFKPAKGEQGANDRILTTSGDDDDPFAVMDMFGVYRSKAGLITDKTGGMDASGPTSAPLSTPVASATTDLAIVAVALPAPSSLAPLSPCSGHGWLDATDDPDDDALLPKSQRAFPSVSGEGDLTVVFAVDQPDGEARISWGPANEPMAVVLRSGWLNLDTDDDGDVVSVPAPDAGTGAHTLTIGRLGSWLHLTVDGADVMRLTEGTVTTGPVRASSSTGGVRIVAARACW